MHQRARAANTSELGFTLIEILVAAAITGIIGAGLTMATVQVMNVNALSVNHITAIKQVENVAYWVNRDVRMAQTIQLNGGSGFPLNLSWVEWDNTTRQVSYIIGSGQLQRSSSVNGTQPTTLIIGQYIDGSTNCQYQNGVFTFRVTASVGGFRPANETRILEVVPRSAQ